MEVTILNEKDVPGASLAKDPANCSVLELKRWLECHGEKKSGRKQELIDRVRRCVAIGKTVDPKVDAGKWYELKKMRCRGETSSSEQLEKIPSGGWKKFPSYDIPIMFNYGHIYHHLVESISDFTIVESEEDAEDLDSGYTSTARPLRKGLSLLNSGFVRDIEDNLLGDNYFVRAHVDHSMKVGKPLNVEIALSCLSGSVRFGRCDCKASALGRCAHVAAVLLSLSEYLKTHGHSLVTPSTSKPCIWNVGKKRHKDPQAIHKGVYKCGKFSSSRIITWDPRPEELRGKVGMRETNDFLKDLNEISSKTNQVSMWELSIPMFYEDYTLSEERKEVLQILTQSLEETLYGFNEIGAKEIEGTLGQSASPRWYEERQLRITASRCKPIFTYGNAIIAGNADSIMMSMQKWIWNNLWFPKTFQSKFMKYGIEEEPKAREAYTTATGNNVKETGMWVNSLCPYLGASPDGLILNSACDIAGIIEIKCLKLLKENSVEELIEKIKLDKVSSSVLGRQCFTVIDNKLLLKTSHMYFYQVQLQLLVLQLPFCDFVLHSPKGPPSVQRIPCDKQFQEKLRASLSSFWHKVFIPEYFEMRVPRRLHAFIV